MNPKANMARALRQIRDGLRDYAAAHNELYDSEIGHDCVLGESWKDIAHGLIGLLKDETADIDCGDFDGSVRAMAMDVGFTAEECDTI